MKVYRQKGIGFVALVYNLMILGIVLYFVFLLGPIYLENHAVKDAMKSVSSMGIVKHSDSLLSAKGKIRNYLAENFLRNSITDVPLENIKLKSTAKGFTLSLNYDVQIHFISNIDMVINFKDQVVVEKI